MSNSASIFKGELTGHPILLGDCKMSELSLNTSEVGRIGSQQVQRHRRELFAWFGNVLCIKNQSDSSPLAKGSAIVESFWLWFEASKMAP